MKNVWTCFVTKSFFWNLPSNGICVEVRITQILWKSVWKIRTYHVHIQTSVTEYLTNEALIVMSLKHYAWQWDTEEIIHVI
jgi:hypothetical protein